MKLLRKMRFCLFVLILAISPNLVYLFADLPDSFKNLPDSEYPLRDTINWKKESDPFLTLLPDVPGADRIQEQFLSYKPEITVQKLYRIDLTNRIDLNSSELFTAIVNIFRKPETQLGYTYHSSTRDRDVILFEKSYVSDKRGKNIDSFPLYEGTFPESISFYQYVDEANFSGTVLKQQIEIDKDYVSFRSTNMNRLWYTIIPVLKAEGTQSEMLMFVDGYYLYIYSATMIKEEPGAKKIGLPIHLPSMFGKRMDVMALWLEDQIMEYLPR